MMSLHDCELIAYFSSDETTNPINADRGQRSPASAPGLHVI